jgi:hypothetical protein
MNMTKQMMGHNSCAAFVEAVGSFVLLSISGLNPAVITHIGLQCQLWHALTVSRALKITKHLACHISASRSSH